MNKPPSILRRALPFVWSSLACALYALGFNLFFLPNRIGVGGVTGISQIIHALFGKPPIGILILLMNIPLFAAGWHLLGRRLFFRSLFCVALSSVLIDVLGLLYVFPPMDPLLACIYGGVSMGFALGVIFSQDATTGGVDIAARLLKLKLTWLPMGRLILLLDLFVLLGNALVFRKLNNALYGLVALYISSLVVDGVLYGSDPAKVAYIISDRYTEISRAITEQLSRGVTVLHGEGSWTQSEKNVLLCAIKRRQIVELKRAVKELDPEAFLIVCDAHEVLGEGFRGYRRNDF